MAKHILDDGKAVRAIFDLHTNLLVANSLEDATQTLIKSIGQLMPTAARAALFVWLKASRQLVPYATRQFGKKQPFVLSQRSFEDVISRKQGVLLPAASRQVTQTGRHRVVLPMIHNDEILAILHVEVDDPRTPIPNLEIELALAYMSRAAPTLETLLLRKQLGTWMIGMIETIVAAIEAKDTYTHGHSERVSRYCAAIADELHLAQDIKRLLIMSALCHDIGKIAVPDAILKKASLLSADEYAEMKLHPVIGSQIIEKMPNANRILSGVKYHHEKWDGTGYPEGLVGEDIPFFGRIVALADTYDAMVSGRSYSGFMEQDDAMQKLDEEKELFDPEIFKAFTRAYDKGTVTLKTTTRSNSPGKIKVEDDPP